MSRRFGRNQRRRAREAVAQAKQAEATAQKLANTYLGMVNTKDRKIAALEAIIEGVRDALGPESVLLEPVLRRMHNYTLRSMQLAEDMRLDMMVPSDDALDLTTIKTHTADVLVAGIADDSWARHVHFNLEIGDDGCLRYVVDQRLLSEPDARRVLGRQVAHFLAREFDRLLATRGVR
jgi:hypothetical protein